MSSVRTRENAEHYTWGEGCEGWRRLQSDGLSVIEERIPPGKGEKRHVHARAHQVFFVLGGTLTIDAGDERLELAAGCSLEVPPGCPHLVRNLGSDDAWFLVISTPSTRGDRTDLE